MYMTFLVVMYLMTQPPSSHRAEPGALRWRQSDAHCELLQVGCRLRPTYTPLTALALTHTYEPQPIPKPKPKPKPNPAGGAAPLG